MSTIEHLRYLSEWIGPRGSGTPEETEAARYAFAVLQKSGLKPEFERFTSALSGWRTYALFALLVLVSEMLFWSSNRLFGVAAVVLGSTAFISAILELCFLPNLLRWVLPKGNGSNVWARIPALEDVRVCVVFLAHLDTHRTPLAFSNRRWLAVFGRLISLSIISTSLLIALFVANLIYQRPLWLWISVLPATEVLLVFLLTFQADLTSFTHGANDNATGASIVLNLAQQLAQERLINTEVWIVFPGCEEVGCYGSTAFAKGHSQEIRKACLGKACWITIDSVGGRNDDVIYLKKEVFLKTTKSDPGLMRLASDIGKDKPDLRVDSDVFSGAYTDGSVGGRFGFRVLTLLGRVREHWHRTSDVFENVDLETLQRNQEFIWALIQKIDATPDF